jgi:hypothetical protein
MNENESSRIKNKKYDEALRERLLIVIYTLYFLISKYTNLKTNFWYFDTFVYYLIISGFYILEFWIIIN